MACRRKSFSRAATIEYINFAFCLKSIAIGQIQVVVKNAKICGISFMTERTIKKFDLQRGYIGKKFKKKKKHHSSYDHVFQFFFFVRANSLKRKARERGGGVEMGEMFGWNVLITGRKGAVRTLFSLLAGSRK